MSRPAAIQGTYFDLRFIKTRKVAQVVIELPIEAAGAFVEMFGTPNPASEIPVALARLSTLVEVPEPKQIEARRGWQDMSLAQQAGIRANEPDFWRFLAERYGECNDDQDAAGHIRRECGVNSRSEFAKNTIAAERWRHLDAEFYVWQRGGR